MRWQVLLQATVGVGALFGFAYLAVERKIVPLAQEESAHRAAAQARVAALEVERAWKQSRRSLESAVLALAQLPSFATLGEVFPQERRGDGLRDALDSAVKQIGGDGLAALFDGRGRPLEGAAALGETASVEDAKSGASSIRVERIDDAPFEVVAVPIFAAKNARADGVTSNGGDPIGILALARPLGLVRLGNWTKGLPISNIVVLLDGTEPITSLLPLDRIAVVRAQGLPPEVSLGGARHSVSEVRLPDDGGNEMRVVALAPISGPRAEATLNAIRLLVLGLGGITFLMVSALLLLSPPAPAAVKPVSAAPVPPEVEPPPADPAMDRPDVPAEPLPVPAPVVAEDVRPPSVPEPDVVPRTPVVSPSPAVSPSLRPDAAGTYSGVPVAAAETLPMAPRDFDASPHSSGSFDPIPGMPESVSEAYSGLGALVDLGEPISGEASPPSVRGSGSHPPAVPGHGDSVRSSGAHAPVRPSTDYPSAPAMDSFSDVRRKVPPSEPNRPATPSEESAMPAPFATRLDSGFGTVADPFGLGGSAGLSSSKSSPGGAPPAQDANEAPSFDAIARAAKSAPPGPIPSSGSDENLPVPKGGLSPGMIAGQGLAHQGPVMAPSPRLEGNLPLPKEQAPHLYDLSPGSPSPDPEKQPTAPSGVRAPDRAGPRGSPGLSQPNVSTGLTSPNLSAVHAPESPASDLAQPFDSTHYRRVYDEFVAAKTRLGESVEGLSFEGFGAKLRASEEGLIARHACRAVRFQVLVKDHAVSLRPQLVR